ncbi:MAG TPA: hypothetical protein VFQ53_16355 [Kofleriaceae bacterium]|nr:hypothetical protein [Kofleriaceae bacterium]
MRARSVVVLAMAMLGACYEPPVRSTPCAITCTDACPGDLTCQNGFCVADGEVCSPSFVQVSAGHGFVCGIDEADKLWCWGSNEHHQIDPSDEESFAFATKIGELSWQSVSAGGGHVCGISDGQLYCWGRNERGQITAAITGDIPQPTEIQFTGAPQRWTAVTAGFNATCAIGDGRMYCWGAGDGGQLGNGTTADAAGPTPIKSMLTDWTAVSSGWGATAAHTCAISTSTGLWCWGQNATGELGDSTRTNSNEPTQVTLPGAPVSVTAAAYSTCASTDAGELYCWGYAAGHALGDPDVIAPGGGDVLAPRMASALTGWTKLTSAEQMVCGLRAGEVWCWGYSASGLGFPDGVWKGGTYNFAQISPGTSDATDVVLGKNLHLDEMNKIDASDVDTGCFIAGNAVRCWGDNRYGQLGQGGPTMAIRPHEIAGGHRWTTLSVGIEHGCGVDVDGRVQCWGSTLYGAVDGTIAGRADTPCNDFPCDPGSPLEVRTGQDVAVGALHTCALDNGAIACWGDNAFQELGAPNLPSAPALIPGAYTDLFEMRGAAACARVGSETHCWGAVVDGVRGPSRITELDAISQISVGGIVASGYHGFGCYLDATQQLFCFGDNTLAQFGNGPLPQPSTCGNFTCDSGECESCPGDCQFSGCNICGNGLCDAGETSDACPDDCGAAPMTKLGRSYQWISVGWDVLNLGTFACGVNLDGTVECWGRNEGGMLDDAVTPPATSPIGQVRYPVQIGGLAGCTQVAAGFDHACALCGETIECWGQGYSLGSRPATTKIVPMPRPIELALEPGDRWIQLVAGLRFTCALSEQGRGYCWGTNAHGALGLGGSAATVPVVVRTQ